MSLSCCSDRIKRKYIEAQKSEVSSQESSKPRKAVLLQREDVTAKSTISERTAKDARVHICTHMSPLRTTTICTTSQCAACATKKCLYIKRIELSMRSEQ
jgi:hypothetical protein